LSWAEVQYVYQSKKSQLKLRVEEDYSLISVVPEGYTNTINEMYKMKMCHQSMKHHVKRSFKFYKENLKIEWMDGECKKSQNVLVVCA